MLRFAALLWASLFVLAPSRLDEGGSRILQSMTRGCEGGGGAQCFNLAFAYESGKLDLVSCDGGVLGGDDCLAPQLTYAGGWQLGVHRDLNRALGLYERACFGGTPQGCLNAGYLYAQGIGGSKDEGRAAGLFQRACDAGLHAGCSNLGLLYLRGSGVPKSQQRATDLFKKSCGGTCGNCCRQIGPGEGP